MRRSADHDVGTASHRFTEPTPFSLTRGVHIEVFVSSWEIECCAPAPVIGEPTSWALTALAPSATWPELDCDRLPPEPGPRVVRGSVVGGIHEEGPRITGTVQRIRFATANYRLVEPRRLEPVPETLILADVNEAPRSLFFDFDSNGRLSVLGNDRPSSLGVLLDLTVP